MCMCDMESDESGTNSAGNRDGETDEYQSCSRNEKISNECE